MAFHYHRSGYGESDDDKVDVSISQQACDCKKLLDFLKIQKIHIIGHFVGGTIALQFALAFP